MAENDFDTIVVGGGIAGLTSAAYLSKKGRKVLLIEKNKECGGLVNTFTHNGFRFDAGVRALLNAGIIFPMLRELQIDLETVESSVSVGLGDEVIHIKDRESLEDYRRLLQNAYPDSKHEIDQLIRIILDNMRSMDVLYGIDNPVMINLWQNKAYIFQKLIPWLPKFLLTIRKINRLNMPVEKYLETVISDRSLRDIISQHFFRSTPTFFAMSYFSLYLDYFYPKGGVGILAEKIEEKYLEMGGRIKTGSTVTLVDAGEKQVVDQEGHAYSYEKLIWAADLKTLYLSTEIKSLSPKVQAKFNIEKDRILSHRGGDSVFTLYLEVDESLNYFRSISKSHFFYTPSKQGLGEIHRKDLDELLAQWNESKKEEVFQWMEVFLRFNTFEISIPGLKDADMVPEGKSGLIISFLAEYDLFRKLKESDWYEEFVARMEDLLVKILADSIYPGLNKKVIERFSFTPLSYAKRVGSSEGAITGWSFQEEIPVIHKMQQSARAVLTPLPSIFQAGQWTYSPSGVPMSILTGKLAADKGF